MSDITKIKVDGEPESSYKLFPKNREFEKRAGGNTGSQSGGEITTLHINVTAVNLETKEATFTADKTPTEMQQASANGPIWCVITFAAGLMAEEAVSFGLSPAWAGGNPAFGDAIMQYHNGEGNNIHNYVILANYPNSWILNLELFGG